MADLHDDNEQLQFACEPKLFGRWSYEGITCADNSLADYLNLSVVNQQVYIPYTAGRYQTKKFKKTKCPLIERLVCTMMVSGGRNNGKKQMAIRQVKQILDLVHILTGQNPLQVLINAIANGGAREDSTRIGSGGTVRRQAVDCSPLRRVNQAIYLMHKGACDSAFRTIKSIQETMADEIVNCSKGAGSNSFACRKKDEIERVAKGNR